MAAWWESLSLLERTFYFMAIPATALLVVQTVLQVVGLSHAADADLPPDLPADLPADLPDSPGPADAGMDSETGLGAATEAGSLRLLTFQGLVAFFTLCGWTGVLLAHGQAGTAVTIVAALAAGLAGLYGMAWLMRALLRLQSSGNIDVRKAIGLGGEVYIPIPPARSGSGKVTLTLQGRFREYDAVTEGPDRLATGTSVRIVDIDRANVLVVEKEE